MWRVCILLALFVGCDAHTVCSGKIVDGDGNPIPGATVRLTKHGRPIGADNESKEDGTFQVGGTHSPTGDPLELTVRKDGFREDSRRLPPISDSTMRIVLERDKKTNRPNPEEEKGEQAIGRHPRGE